ncbi:FkbM family methyltransferase [Candidatus Pacearchaeota archaeon]|nr:FkbM family methyltransferase [Candidatus Pacearchaeota archaeon]
MTNYTAKKIKLGLKAFTKINNWWDFFLDYLKLKKGYIIGSFSVLIHNKMKNGQVYAIEPSKQNYELLLDQIGINDLKIKSFKIALSDKKGKMKLYEGNHSARGSLFREEGKNFEIIETQTMKNFFEENKIEKCDLMKMDIEGGEYSVLYSTPKEIFDKIDKIFLEVHEIDGQNKLDLIEFLNKQGFKIEIKDKSFNEM